MNKLLVLVVEDDPAIRNLMSTTLKSHDYRFLTAPTGASAIMQVSTAQPDIVLLDLGLPDMDGVEIIRKIRTWSQMPIIVISARAEDTDKIEALDAGADDFEPEEDCFTIYTAPDDFNAVADALTAKGYTFASAQLEMVPQNYQKLEKEEDKTNMEKMLDLFEDDDDVQNVWHNWDRD